MTQSPSDPQLPVSPANSIWSRLRRIWRRIENVVFGLVFLLVVLYFILQTSAVQNWLIHKITAYLSSELKTTVSIQHVGIEFFDNLVLDGLYIQDLQGDTLVYAAHFSAGLNSNIFSLFWNKLEFDEINLTDAKVRIFRPKGAADNNAQFLMDYFSGTPSNEPEKPPKPFVVKIKNLQLKNVVFESDDRENARYMLFKVPSANIKVNKIDMAEKVMDIRSAELKGFVFDFKDYPTPDVPETADDSSETSPPDTTHQKIFQFVVRQFSLEDGRFIMDKFRNEPADPLIAGVMDYDHLQVNNIQIKGEQVEFNEDLAFTGILKELAATERSGFQILHSSAAKVVVNDTLTALYQTKILTQGGSSLGDTIMLHYGTYYDYLDFNSRVRLDVRLAEGSKLRLGDVMFFNEVVKEQSFFIQNEATIADVKGLVEGKVKRLNGRDLWININNSTIINADFDGNDMNEGTDRLQIHVKFKKMKSDIASIKQIIPGFNPPASIYRLGHIGYEGDYDIFFGYDHILNGYLITDIGSGKFDMKLNLAQGVDNAQYSGRLNMNQFDLASWTGNKDFGKTTFHVAIEEGSKGLSLETMRVKVKGAVDTFYYRGYNYRNLEMKGAIQDKIFDGKLGINDPNVDFDFDGAINFRDTIPQMAFSADVRRLDLEALNLLHQDWILSGKIAEIRLNAHDLNDLNGNVLLRNVLILQDHEISHRIDSVRLSSYTNTSGISQFKMSSNIADGFLSGRFRITTVLNNLVQLFARYHPEFAARLDMSKADSLPLTDQYEMELQIKDTKTLLGLVSEDLSPVHNAILKASVDATAGQTKLSIWIPELQYQSIKSSEIGLTWEGKAAEGSYYFSVPRTVFSENGKLPPIILNGFLKRNALGIKLLARDTAKQSYFIKGINLDGVLSVVDSLWQIQFNSSELAMFNEDWVISDANYLRFGKEFIAAKEFEFFSGNKRILLDSLNGGRGLALSMTNFDLDFVNRFIADSDYRFRGKVYDFDVRVNDVFKMEGIGGFFSSDTVFVNEIPYGDITGNVDMANPSAPLSWKIFLQNEDQKLRVAGAWLASGTQTVHVNDVDMDVEPGTFTSQVDATGFPLKIIETFVPGISKTTGRFDADVRLGGKFNRIAMNGLVLIKEGQVQMDYLKSMYHLKNQPIRLSEYKIWADGDTIWDATQKSMAFVRGGLKHDHFQNWVLDCGIKSRKGDNFMILNTLPEDNALYYGQGLGEFDATFSGTFSRTNILVTATTGKDTRLYIPLTTAADAEEVNFIKFVKKTPVAPDSAAEKLLHSGIGELKGLNFEMNLSMTDAAEVQMIFDEQAGDVIKGRGTGNIKLVINREGEFKMYGNYQIRKGEYLFTLLNWINKPFTVSEGGTINWYGDPYGAQISLDATYEENTPVYNLVQEEIQIGGGATQDDLEKDARKPTRTVVTMHLKGDLLKPSIGFDLEFPNATGSLKTFIDNKLRSLHSDQNELNRQVFGLVVVGSFLPNSSSGFLQNSDYVSSAFNTLTQVLTNQFSSYLSGLAAEWFGGAVSSIDFDIAYNEYRNSLKNASTNTDVGRELQLRLSSGFANDRIKIQVGSQFGVGSQGATTTNGFLGEDVVVEIQLTANHNWRLKIYQRTEPDITVGQLRGRYGVGFTFQREFDTWDEMLHGARQNIKKK
jgi:hypothetical protein